MIVPFEQRCVAPLPLLVLALASAAAAADVTTRYDEGAGRIVVSVPTGGENVDIDYISVSGYEGIPRVCGSADPSEDCLQLHASSIPVESPESAGVCYKFSVSFNVTGIIVSTCIPHNGSHLFGGAEQFRQLWPIEAHVYSHYPYVTSQRDNVGVAERYWLFSDGRYVHAEANVPLFINQNVNDSVGWLCLEAQKQPPYSLERPGVVLNKTTCVFPDARRAHQDALQRFLGKPTGVPDGRVVAHPIWSTRAVDDDEDAVRSLATRVVAEGFNASQLQLDGRWESCYGSLAFDAAHFPDAKKLVRDLHALGFGVALRVHPFVNLDCQPYHSEALARGYFVTGADGSHNTTWWNGEASVVDFTDPDAAAWWAAKLWALQNEAGADSLAFEAGEASWLPAQPRIRPVELSPAQFTRAYLQVAAQFGAETRVRVAERSQALATFLRMGAKDSSWGLDNGLASLVTTLLQMNVAGYPFVLPDAVGGSGRGAPTKELFVRWLQAAVFMPALQFSYAPWDFDDETVAISRQLTGLHARYAPRIVQLMESAVSDGSPVNPPVWWLDPTDPVALTINSEFLLGEDLLAAPVLEEGALSRDIYLPRGNWTDEADPGRPVYEGPVWLFDYPAPLHVLPYFTRASDIPEPPAKGGSSQAELFIPAISTWVTNTALLYTCCLTLRHFLT